MQDPDSAKFLERVYSNGWKTLKVGKVRYGIMLRDDGIVLNDGTTARLAEDEFFMTTTSANAATVMANLEFLLQACWCDLKVRVTSVTDQWTGMALAGPASRGELQDAIPDLEIGADALPHMGFIHAEIGDAPVRIHRMSFSGELAIEIFTPAGSGQHVWDCVMSCGETRGITPYGTEAMAALRIEKGHVAGPELDGRSILSDLGLGALASKKEHFIGNVLKDRPPLTAPERPALVGLETVRPQDRIRSGSILFAAGTNVSGHSDGHVNSTTYSVHLQKNVALGLLSNGTRRHGETIVCANPIENQQIEVKIVAPCFYYPDGERLHT